MKILDFRSDTVTRPTPAMRRAMAEAEVGDDVYFEDPTVNRLQERAADLLGKEAALFVPSGTMGNQVCLRTLTRPGDVVLAGKGAHVLLYEQGGAAALAGVQIETIGHGGLFDAGDVAAAIHPDEQHYAHTALVTVENTHNVAGGRVFALDAIREIAGTARARGLAVHLDGARLFNAVVATGTPAAEWAEPFDTVTFCLSKGLGAPVGSVVCTSRARMHAIHRARKLLGGGMRQVGMLAAAGLHALEHHVERLADDHRNARRLADGLAALDVEVRETPETNMVYFRVDDTEGFLRETRDRGLWINPLGPGVFRAVTHLDVDAADVEDALGRAAEALKALRGQPVGGPQRPRR
ncbi:MAG TPA: low-specificity L-threonine aldolase [Myxococcota bacterium]|nr:low-specificity L-threonine aldolase [Myxococcota bacterium]